ncbi:phosphotransferase [Bacillus spongiae]|uniref:Phosphotransferase n=1 Tax=Bacillus spongiae TaxID=2683610 RepID=A0ABU8HH27_9BACI
MKVELGRMIGEGGCAKTFEWKGSHKLIKLAKENTNEEAMKREYDNSVFAFEMGLSVPQPFELLSVNDRAGIVFERVHGTSLLERYMSQLTEQAYSETGINPEDIRIIARILSEIHVQIDIGSPLIPSPQKEYLTLLIKSSDRLTLAEKESVIFILNSLPTKQLLCHGDPNPGNVLIRNDGSPVMIDWMDAAIGNPEVDIAEFILMIRYAILPDHLPNHTRQFFDSKREIIIHIFMDEYTRLTGLTYHDAEPWLLPVAARKLSVDAIPGEEKSLLIQEIRRRLPIQKNSVVEGV